MTDGGAEPRKPTRAVEAVIYSWGIRWPCPRDTNPDTHDMRLRMLMHDCASIAPADLKRVGDRLATRLKWLPSAAEVHAEYEALLADRARQEQPSPATAEPWGDRAFPQGTFSPGSREHHEWIANVNRYQRANDKPSRLVLDDGSQQSRVVLLSDGWTCNGDGTVNPPESRQAA